MGTYTLTPNVPDPYTGLQNDYVAWHFVDGEDINTALKWLKANAGWDSHISFDPDNDTQQRISLTKFVGNADTGMMVTWIVHETQWFTYDDGSINVLDEDYVSANYQIAGYTLPIPPIPEPKPIPPPMGMPPPSGGQRFGDPSQLTVVPPRPAQPSAPPPSQPTFTPADPSQFDQTVEGVVIVPPPPQ